MKPVQPIPSSEAATDPGVADTVQLQAIWLRLQERERTLEEQASALRVEMRHELGVLACRRQESVHLETRVQNQRRKLAALQDETVHVEAVVTADVPTAELAESRPAILLPWAATRLVGDLKIAIADVADQQQIVGEQQEMMGEVKRTWLADWQSSLAALARRETELSSREDVVAERELDLGMRESRLRDRSADLIRQEQTLRCEEVRLATAQCTERGERGRLIAMARSRSAAGRARAAYLARLQTCWERERREELARYQEMRAGCEADRRDLMKLRLALQKKQGELAARARYLLERELVVTQAQQQLLAEDASPAAAEQELRRRLSHLHEVVERPLRGLEKKEQELDERHDELEQFRQALLEDQHWLEAEKGRRLKLHRSLQLAHAQLESARVRWKERLRGLRGQRNHLLRQVRDLTEQLERLSVLMLEGEQEEGPQAMAA